MMPYTNRFAEAARKGHELLGTLNKCYILVCGRDTTVALRGLESGTVNFYCERCAEELMEFGLFERVKRTIDG